jgi:hypothetical protein
MARRLVNASYRRRVPGSQSETERRYRAVVSDPENDELRFELAGCIDPYDPVRGTFIKMQVIRSQRERAIGFLSSEDEPSDAERRIIARHGLEWTQDLRRYVNHTQGRPTCTFHRGLVAHIEIDPDVFVEFAPRVLAMAPIRHVDFAPLPAGSLAPLLASEALAQLDSVGFAGVGLDDDAVVEIAACPRLAQCLYLDLSFNPLGPRAFAALAASPYLRQLLVVKRAQDPEADHALTSHPGEVVLPVNRTSFIFCSCCVSEPGIEDTWKSGFRLITDEGHALEAAHGEVAWLRLRNRVSRFDARWAVDNRHRPVHRTPSTGSPAGPPQNETRLAATSTWKTLTIKFGSEWAPDSPFGLDVLQLDANGRFLYENHNRGHVRRLSGGYATHLGPAIGRWLDASGFPLVPAHSIPPGSSLVQLTVHTGVHSRPVVLLHYFSALKFAGYSDLVHTMNQWTSWLREGGGPDHAPPGLHRD